MRTIGISHKTRYWQHYCFSNPPAGHRYARMPDLPWHIANVKSEFLRHSKFFFPFPRPQLYHTYNSVVANHTPWVVEVESYLPRLQGTDPSHPSYRWSLQRLASEHCKALIFTSANSMAQNVEHLSAAGVDLGKMSVVYRAVEQFQSLAKDDRFFTIIFAGNGFYRKGGVELLKAFQQLDRPEARLTIISTLEVDWGVKPDPADVEWTKRTIAIDPRITLYERLPHHELIDHMRASDIFVSTTFMDPFNNTVLEAMGAGLPVICSNVGALAEVARDARNGWVLSVADRSSASIAEEVAMRMAQLMDDPALRSRMGLANGPIIEERFALPVRNAALTKIYDAALK